MLFFANNITVVSRGMSDDDVAAWKAATLAACAQRDRRWAAAFAEMKAFANLWRMSNNVANLRLDIEVPSPWEEFVASLPTPIASAEARPGSLPEQPQQDARNEDADSDTETTPMESSKVEDSRAEESEEDLESGLEWDEDSRAEEPEVELDSEWEQDAAAAPASTAPRSRFLGAKRSRDGTSPSYSKYYGVQRLADTYNVRIRDEGGIRTCLGSFKSEVEAAKAYDARARQLGRLNRLNFPSDDDPVVYFGVKKKNQRFQAKIGENGTTKYLGNFSSAVEAAKAYDARARQLGYFKKLNFPTAEEVRSNKTRSRPSTSSANKRAKRAPVSEP